MEMVVLLCKSWAQNGLHMGCTPSSCYGTLNNVMIYCLIYDSHGNIGEIMDVNVLMISGKHAYCYLNKNKLSHTIHASSCSE